MRETVQFFSSRFYQDLAGATSSPPVFQRQKVLEMILHIADGFVLARGSLGTF